MHTALFVISSTTNMEELLGANAAVGFWVFDEGMQRKSVRFILPFNDVNLPQTVRSFL
jgi:hypothetical protein